MLRALRWLVVAALVLAWPAYRGLVALQRHRAEAAVTAEAHRLGPFPGARTSVFTKATYDTFLFHDKAAFGLSVEDPRPVEADAAALNAWLTRAGYSATTRPRPQPPRYQLDPVDPSNPAGCLVQALPTRNGQGYPRLSRASIDRYPRLAYRCPDVEYRRPGFVVWAVFRGADQLRDRRHDHVDRYTVFIVRGR